MKRCENEEEEEVKSIKKLTSSGSFSSKLYDVLIGNEVCNLSVTPVRSHCA